jgi:S-adenosylmethionine:tRNA ribosyltransferase-isomerase
VRAIPPSQPRDQLVASYAYDLPAGSIAQTPAERRHDARLLVVGEAVEQRRIADLPELLSPGDLLVVNDTRVLPVRLFARKPTGGAVEILLLRPTTDGGWQALVKPSSKVRPGTVVTLRRRGSEGEGPSIRVGEILGEGTRAVQGESSPLDEDLLNAWGELPLPPYIDRESLSPADRTRYQTVFAAHPGAVAAPTAGLHFSEELLTRLRARGIQIAQVTLHVGPGTFRPVRTDTLAEHPMHAESYRVPHATAQAVRDAEQRGGRIIAVGTTSCRSLEAWHRAGRPTDGAWRQTDLFLHPGAPAQLALSLLTNFHLPSSTLLMLVASFLGRERALALYEDALAAGYRFYSYGDAMLIL